MYDRCLLCSGFLSFHGISIKPVWLRWVFCPQDEVYFGVNEHGAHQVMTKKIPKEAYFVRFTAKGELV